ncbi:MAG: D-serine ammonia-lyase [Clostridia bacterium]|nr:D-serine ammonia-lyase [Clostridia bacterium]
MKVLDKTIEQWLGEYPLLKNMMDYKPVQWLNPRYDHASKALKKLNFSISDIVDAEGRLRRFAPFIAKAFPETDKHDGIIESPLLELVDFHSHSKVYLKCDHQLPISGSVKARGGIYEILRYAEELLFKNGLLKITDPYDIICDDKIKKFLSNYKVVVSSTGNLGLSIGIISAKLGFKVYVHMSHDAMTWKKDLLRSIGCEVIEHESDYSYAVEMGRKIALKDPTAYFVDDENSKNLFLGYAVSAFRLKEQLKEAKVEITSEKPLFVYIPCGVGGGPGGILYGLKEVFGDRVHCMFVEPTHSPCMLLGMMTEYHDQVCVQDFHIDNITIADGLAVGRASKFVGKIIDELLLGVSTVEDDELKAYLKLIDEKYEVFLEPSATAGVKGFYDMLKIEAPIYGQVSITPEMVAGGTHIIWSTGGNMVPDEVRKKYL